MPKILKILFLLCLFPIVLHCADQPARVSSKKVTPLPTIAGAQTAKSGIEIFLSLFKKKKEDYTYLLEVTPAQLKEKTIGGVYKYSLQYFEFLEAGTPDAKRQATPGYEEAFENAEKHRIDGITKQFNPSTDVIIVYYRDFDDTTEIGWDVINKTEGKTKLSSALIIGPGYPSGLTADELRYQRELLRAAPPPPTR